MKTCCFIGHSQIEEKDLAKRVREKIEMCIALGDYYFKKAIIMRNQYLVEHSQYAICYVKYSYGGAIQTYQYAKRKGLYLFNLAE